MAKKNPETTTRDEPVTDKGAETVTNASSTATVRANAPTDMAGSLLAELESLIERADHFVDAGLVLKFRKDGLDLVQRIRAAL